MLIIKGEYSGKLFETPLLSKSIINVFEIIRKFNNWVKHKYKLLIYILKYNNKRAIIAIKGELKYKIWAAKQGIKLKLAPLYTYKLNRVAEKAEQEIITCLIKMQNAAYLLENL